jgi:hypothetical protein
VPDRHQDCHVSEMSRGSGENPEIRYLLCQGKPDKTLKTDVVGHSSHPACHDMGAGAL